MGTSMDISETTGQSHKTLENNHTFVYQKELYFYCCSLHSYLLICLCHCIMYVLFLVCFSHLMLIV
jgi:hypothetical protein